MAALSTVLIIIGALLAGALCGWGIGTLIAERFTQWLWRRLTRKGK